MTPIHVRYTKWDGSLHWHFDGTVVEQDEHGTWLLVSPGSEYRRGDEAARRDEHGFVVLVTADRPWTAYFNAVPRTPHGHHIYVDINTVARWEGNTVHLIDLDLDVTLSPRGEVGLLDEDEFEAHQRQYAYPQEIIDLAVEAAGRVAAEIGTGTEPFGTRGPALVARHLGWAAGRVVAGHGAASGQAGDPRFPHGTLALQFPHFRDAGIPIDGYEAATINADLQFTLRPTAPLAHIDHLQWLRGYPPESFDFLEARLAISSTTHGGLVYRPDPATKPEFHQPETVLEFLGPRIPDIAPGVPVSIWVDPDQGRFVT